jgi:predicted transcriptional regulator
MSKLCSGKLAMFVTVALLTMFVLTFDALASAQKDSLEKVKQETSELLDALKNYGVEQRGEALETIKATMEKLDRRIDDLEAEIDGNWDEMKDGVRKESRESLRALRKQRNRVAEWYGGLKNSSADAWNDIKNGFSNSYRELQKAWEKSLKHFSTDK